MGRSKKVSVVSEVGGTSSVSWSWLIPLIVSVLKPVIKVLTPMIREAMEKWLKEWYPKAVATPNPWDDFLVGILCDILGIKVE